MSAQTSYFKLGIFVVVATALLCAGVIVLGAGKLLERTYIVETYMVDSVEGLGTGSAVKYKGVELGEVKEILIAARKYDPGQLQEGRLNSPILVEFAIRQKMVPNLTEAEFEAWLKQADEAGMRARLASAGLTGPTFLELVYLEPERFPAPAITWSPPALYVPSAPSTSQVLIESVQGILRKLNSLDLKKVVDDVDALITTAREKLTQLDVGTINDEATSFLEEIRASNNRLQEILNNPNIDPSLEDLRATLQNAKDATARIDEILNDPKVDALIDNLSNAGAELKPTLDDLRRAVRRIDRLIAAEQANLKSVVEELNRAMINIRELTDDAKQNPSRILFGDPPPRSKNGDDR